eukprot:CAMPEP_0117746538 /NCGR_PEP_ID=MMETSP0947-20121206/8003_1 /TAXON_ID=44440 /ORGANISM="Chattonella subsalsa, Strain CCMP2191" /LENGTH=365 /DNA_ID=CAMNT_0005563875 /DNA_START=97 /DNA_END=1194 /DNA_ORIENTATION=-
MADFNLLWVFVFVFTTNISQSFIFQNSLEQFQQQTRIYVPPLSIAHKTFDDNRRRWKCRYDIHSLVEEFNSYDMPVNFRQMKQLTESYPDLTILEDKHVASIIQILGKEAGLKGSKLWAVLRKEVSVLGENPARLKQKLQFLKKTFNISTKELKKMLIQHPKLLHYELETHIEPFITFFEDVYNDSPEKLKRAVVKYPLILGYSKTKILIPRLALLCDLLVLDVKEAKLLMVILPQLFWMKKSTLEPKVEFLQEDVGLTSAQVGQLALAYPSLLTLSLENNLKPKVEYLLNKGLGKKRLRPLFMGYPSVIGSSFEKKIKPRFEEIDRLGMDLGEIDLIQLFHTDKAFRTWVAKVTSGLNTYCAKE